MKRTLLFIAATLLAWLPIQSSAQTYPARTVSL